MATTVLPDDGILLHIGPHKTGTTAIQGALAAARPQLRDAGILYPGPRPEHNKQAAAAIQRVLGWERRTVDRTSWLRLVERVRAHPGRAVISSEVFCEATADAAHELMGELDPARVTVLLTLRPLEKLLPSNWQQYIKSGYRIRYQEWLEDVLESRDKRPVTPSFWLRNNHPALIRRWCEAAGGPERVSVLIVNPGEPRSLFDSFEDLLRLPRQSLNHDESGPSNRSLSLPEVELLRQLNRRVRHEVGYDEYYRYIKRGAVRRLVEGRRPGRREPRVTTPAWAVERARGYSRSDVAEISELGVGVLGDLDALAPTGALPDAQVAEVSETVPTTLAAAFLTCLLETALEEAAAHDRGLEEARSALARAVPSTVGAQLDRAVAGVRRRARDAWKRRRIGGLS
jgi:hypothetical protein